MLNPLKVVGKFFYKSIIRSHIRYNENRIYEYSNTKAIDVISRFEDENYPPLSKYYNRETLIKLINKYDIDKSLVNEVIIYP